MDMLTISNTKNRVKGYNLSLTKIISKLSDISIKDIILHKLVYYFGISISRFRILK